MKSPHPGRVLFLLGFGGLFLGLANHSLNMIEKVAIVIVCMAIIVLGGIIGNPLFESIRNDPPPKDFEQMEDFKK